MSGSTDAIVDPRTRLGSPRAWLVWVLATTFVVWLFAIQTGYAVVSPEIQKSAGLSLKQIGVAAAIYTWVFAAVQFFSGALLDRFGSRPLLAIAVGFVTVGAFLYAGSVDFAVLAVAQTVLAIGASFGFVGAGYVGGKWFVAARYGLMFGLVQACASLGSAVSQPAILALLQALTWQQLLVAFGCFGLALVVLFVMFVRDPAPTGAAGADSSVSARPRREHGVVRGILVDLGRCFANRQVILAALLTAASFGTMLAVGTLWGPRIMEARGASTAFATVLTAVAWLGLAVGAPLVNIVSDRWGSRKLPAAIALALQALAIGFVVYLPDESSAVAVVLMFAVGLFSGAQMLGFTVAGESVPSSLIGSASAIVNGSAFIVSGLLASIPTAFLPNDPTLADFQGILWIMPAVLVVGVVASLLLRDPPVRRG
ncbi:MFS transporter [Agromyces protaetiae]|uniref:MFS transporter n=1 Tax=Agromyces protaetiae TaxID=2509455 RepID=A0A4P6FBL7_9MICO|nr:MFS transporter [Agromyces protaetiae]QAY73670.1 MFS transporter [Agromyces protaetiae]